MIPPSASTSRTTVPLAIPPMAGLQDIWPIVSRCWVSRRVRAPVREAQRGTLGAGMAATNHDDVVLLGHERDLKNNPRREPGTWPDAGRGCRTGTSL